MAAHRSIAEAASFALRARQPVHRLPVGIRKASTASPPKPRLLEKPERFNPPSHGQRLKAKPKTYGAPLSEAARKAQKTRQYPHMMPPEGSFLHWFLTNRTIHTVISLSILISLVIGTWFQNFIHTTPYQDMLPPNSMFFAHPYQFLRQYFEVYQMHTQHNTKMVMERRKATVDDVQKRSEYRRAHGLDSGDRAGWFGGWTAKTDAEMLGPGLQTGTDSAAQAATDASPVVVSDGATGAESDVAPQRKKVFGIW